jgi:replicative DNA helicase
LALVDKRSIFGVLGCLLKQPSLLDDSARYKLEKDDFPEQFHTIIFAAISNLYNDGISSIDYLIVDNYLSKYTLQYKIFIENNGIEYLQKAAATAKIENFDYMYNRVKKFSLLREYAKRGIDISCIYDENITDLTRQEKMQEQFDNYTIEDIAEIIDGKIIEIKSKFLINQSHHGIHASENILELKEELKKTPEIGLPMRGDIMNLITRGARLRKLYMRSLPTSVGKAIPDETIIPTLDGMKKVKDIKKGDYLFGQNGKPTKVLNVFPQKEEKEIWELHFLDGRKAECCKDHLWEYKRKGVETYRVETIEQIYERAKKLKNGFRDSKNKGYSFSVRINMPVEYSTKKYDIDPYIMGLILGDGSFRFQENNKTFNFSSNDEELVQAISTSLNMEYKKNSQYNYSYTFKLNEKKSNRVNLWVEELLKSYPLLWNVKSQDKFIPQNYLEGDIEQRYSLLQGLLDTDGYIDKKGSIRFTTASSLMRDQIIVLINSLGMIAKYGIDKRKGKYTNGECYYINIQCKTQNKRKLFRLKRKLEIVENVIKENKRRDSKIHSAIVDIKPTSKKTKMTCFTVDNEDALFLMNDFIVTHNTRLAIADACNLGTNEIYSEIKQKWINNGIIVPTLFITTELEMDEVQTCLLSFLSNVNESHILDGDYETGEEERVDYAGKVLKEGKLYIEYLPNFCYHDVENLIRKYSLLYKIKFFFFDYIHTTIRMLSEIGKETRGIRLREDNMLHMFSSNLKELANELGIFIYTASQLSGEWEGKKTANQNVLRGAKALADKLDVGYIGLIPTAEDIDSLSHILDKTYEILERPNLVYHIYKNRRGSYQNVKLWNYADLGTCRIKNLFLTTNDYTLIPVQSIQINVTK